MSGLSTVPVFTSQGETFYVVWRDNHDGSWDVYFSKSVDQGKNWSQPEKISDTAAEVNYPTIAVNSVGVIMIVWEETTDQEYCRIYSNLPFCS